MWFGLARSFSISVCNELMFPSQIESSFETAPASVVIWLNRGARTSAFWLVLTVEESWFCRLLTWLVNADVWDLRIVTSARADARSLVSTPLRVDSERSNAAAL